MNLPTYSVCFKNRQPVGKSNRFSKKPIRILKNLKESSSHKIADKFSSLEESQEILNKD